MSPRAASGSQMGAPGGLDGRAWGELDDIDGSPARSLLNLGPPKGVEWESQKVQQ